MRNCPLLETESLVVIGLTCFSWGLCVYIFIMQITGCGCPAFSSGPALCFAGGRAGFSITLMISVQNPV